MTAYEYKVVPFVGRMAAGDKDGAMKVAGQLEKVIGDMAGQGWEFFRIDRIQIRVRPGCLSALLGAKVDYIGFDQVVFRKEKELGV